MEKHNNQKDLLNEQEELAEILEEIDILLRHVIFRIREKDARIFSKKNLDALNFLRKDSLP